MKAKFTLTGIRSIVYCIKCNALLSNCDCCGKEFINEEELIVCNGGEHYCTCECFKQI